MKTDKSKSEKIPGDFNELFDSSEKSEISTMLEQRAHKRITIELEADLILDSNTQVCTTADLSAGGVKLKLKNSLFKNVRINILNSGDIPGEIMWMDGDCIGVKFLEDESEIIDVLARITS